MSRIRTIAWWHNHWNAEVFNGKLSTPGFGVIRSHHTDGYYEHYPGRKKKGYIRISKGCFDDEDLLRGTILHEMIHQWQFEIMGIPCDHDATFKSFAKKLERLYRIQIR